ncbi:hypothetical protein EXT68_03190 [Pectobacterium parmentieri]|uniref:Lipoprotein n=2 Tax=Pectobacterium parmentieri TaxID=1905730 RepID=A0A0H3I197_PECPM|nr:hypothetical protein [Pectobacterium parmentieri]AFI89812.1 Hypothetical protein W5S_1721 [Pectobacterium parmentieri]MBI0469224.1 hypothetical protein [Pectobacterium parmentieri]MBI0491849.1 hypothetical protein [Pectobacterium parmentieri]MBI0553132.1 hypothetical protein [Pectobacterium parmentieri]MBI0566471.1 hypothetical protein [Pectobacterium parmentieri]
MKKYKFIIFIPILLLSGCYSDYIKDRQVDNLNNMFKEYCEARGVEQCERYHLCVIDSYSKVKGKRYEDVSIAISYITLYSPIKYNSEGYSHLMKNTYELLNDNPNLSNDPSVTIGLSFFIYAHNSCAGIIEDKTYNIDAYMPLLRKKLNVK